MRYGNISTTLVPASPALPSANIRPRENPEGEKKRNGICVVIVAVDWIQT